jgi:predicted O-methyltransferase YrrM
MKSGRVIISVLSLSLVFSLLINCRGQEKKHEFGVLTALADKYKTDKGSGGHHYTEVYEYFFYPIKNNVKKVLEIGVSEGASLKMWTDYFPKAMVYGIDIKDKSRINSKTIKTFIADQADRKKLQNFIDASGAGFDIILDDGGHTIEQQQVSIGYLFRHLKRGGFYIIEDVHTSLNARYRSGIGATANGENTTLAMIDNFIRTGNIRSQYMTRKEENYLTANIVYCDLLSRNNGHSITCIFKKQGAS